MAVMNIATKFLVVGVFLMLTTSRAYASADVQIEIDDRFPRLVHEFFSKEAVDEELVSRIADSAGAAVLLHKVRSHGSDANMELLKESLRRAHGGDVWKADPFSFWNSRREREKTAALLDQIRSSGQLAQRVGARLEPLLPEGFEVRTRIVLVVGGASAGWTNGDGNFQVGLDQHASDPLGVIEMTAAHEIYHLAQEKMLPPGPTDADNPHHRVAYFLYMLVREGTASLLDDVQDFEGDGKLLEYLRDKQTKNRQRLPEAFTLFETLVLRTANDNEADLGQLYAIGFLDQWGSSAYEVGRAMAEAIIAADGVAAIPGLLKAGPHAFVERYLELSARNTDLPQFSGPFKVVTKENAAVKL
jgi:hypothetical protein